MRTLFTGLLIVGTCGLLFYYTRISENNMIRGTSNIDHASQSQTKVPDNSTVTRNTLKNIIVDDPEKIHGGTVNATLYTLVVDPDAQHDEVLKTVKSFDLHFALGDRTYDWVFITPYMMSGNFKHEIRSEWRGAIPIWPTRRPRHRAFRRRVC
jgi:hypothetical protein